MQKAVHSMRLRSRSSMSRTNPENASASVAVPSGRSVLGDVSNKRTIQGNEGGNGGKRLRATKKFRSVFSSQTSSNTLKSEEPRDVQEIEDKENGAQTNRAQDEPLHAGQKRKRGKLSARNDVARETRSSQYKTDTESSDPRIAKKCKGPNAEGTDPPDSKSTDDRGTCLVKYEDRREEVEPRNLNSCLIPENYRLHRSTFDGTNFTTAIAPHDRVDAGDVLMVTEYVTDIFQYLYAEETFTRPNPYMKDQKDINARMRAILVDWLVEVHMKFRLVPETLYLCINIIDRYCNMVQVKRGKLQLVGVTALLIACKYEEIYPPEVRDCVYITDRAYQRQEVLDMEHDMLQKLRFKITVPTAYPFLQRFLSLVKASQLTRVASNYYMERTLQEHELLSFRPSVVCASAVILALNNPDIHLKDGIPVHEFPGAHATNILLEYTGFQKSEIFECSAIMSKKIAEEPVTASRRQLVAVKRKYDNRKFSHVSKAIELPDEGSLPFRAIESNSDRE